MHARKNTPGGIVGIRSHQNTQAGVGVIAHTLPHCNMPSPATAPRLRKIFRSCVRSTSPSALPDLDIHD